MSHKSKYTASLPDKAACMLVTYAVCAVPSRQCKVAFSSI